MLSTAGTKATIKPTLAILLLTFVAVVILSPETPAVTKRCKSVVPSPWSFQIAADGSMDEDQDEGIRFSLKHHYSPYAAMRLNLGITGQTVPRVREVAHYPGGYYYEIEDDEDFDATGANLSAQYLFYPNPNRRVNFFFGLGPRLSARDADSDLLVTYEYNDYPYTVYEDVIYHDWTKVGFGLEGSVGMEWFLGKRFSLLAEYGVIVQNEWFVFEQEFYDRDGRLQTDVESIDDGVHWDGSRVKLGVAIYF